MSTPEQMVLFVFKCSELIVEAWVGMVPFSLIKMFKEPTLFY